ncbi:sulfur controller-2 protein [Lasiosphaeria miniovina]|uniref:Sulfur controller-2 protein n=1 Tax=Lasiosphaeria miniovina TaxID=1954250 RepID=A0AA40AKT0_9PEZI|nr:sulfur controller-2 protein [Lasiosphaeria miniovina]KAK0717668.1 sulfur controller-2 protein [Lasiosphaeria miniovina]
MSTSLIGKTVTPFLKEHIPSLYAPIGKPQNEETAREKEPNSRYCYRHRPDSKCRRAADEAKMVMIQNELDKLSSPDQQAITHVWSLFSAAPARHRELMLQGVLAQLCFPQLSLVSREVNEALKIDFITALPVEISQKILCFLDTVSLTKAAQVSQRWRLLADDDAVWVRMCEQHVNRKCTKCGWGLPLLERRKLRNYTRQKQMAKSNPQGRVQELMDSSRESGSQQLVPAGKRQASTSEETPNGKRRRVNGEGAEKRQDQEPKMRSWKAVYKDRWQVGYNWKFGRCSVMTLKGHTNGVTCLQLDDNILASGSYDATIKIWNTETGEEIRTLRGHEKGIRTLQFDDSKLISGSLDNTIKIWNWHTGECISTINHTDGIVSVHFDAQLLASGSIDKSVKIFDFKSQETFCLKGHSDWVNSTRLDINSRTVMSASDDTTTKLWDLDTRRVIRTFEGHVGHVQQVLPLPAEYEPDEELTAGITGSADNTDTLSVASGTGRGSTPSISFTQPERSSNSTPRDDEIRALYGEAFVDDPSRPLPPRYFLTGGLDSTIRLWDSATGRCLKTMFGHLEGVWSLAGDTIRVISGANDGMVKCWEPRSGKCDATFVGHRGPVTCVGLSDSRMASGSEDGEVRIYSFKDVVGNGSEVGTPS